MREITLYPGETLVLADGTRVSADSSICQQTATAGSPDILRQLREQQELLIRIENILDGAHGPMLVEVVAG